MTADQGTDLGVQNVISNHFIAFYFIYVYHLGLLQLPGLSSLRFLFTQSVLGMGSILRSDA